MPAILGHFFSNLGIAVPAFLFVITLVVFFHELGHFVVARLCGVKVEAFSIGFGREIFGFTDRKGTRWKVAWVPLGGYVKFLGDADVSSRPDQNVMQEYEAKRIAGEHAESEPLHLKPVWQRALVAAAGPIANFILAIVIFAAVTLVNGKPAAPPIVDSVMSGSPAEMAGLKAGDVIVRVGNIAVHDFADLQRIVAASPGSQVQLTIIRNRREMAINVTPSTVQTPDAAGVNHPVGRIGIRDATVGVGVLEAFSGGVSQTWYVVAQTGSYVAQIVTGRQSPDQLHGIIGIAAVSYEAARVGFVTLLGLAGLMSVSIGLVNLLPIPVLDGGHLLYYGFEAVRGKPLGERAQEVGFRIGLAFVLSLLLLSLFNDRTYVFHLNPF
jgi:regulator of sigma E protease